MTSITDIRQFGTTLNLVRRPIYEPLSAPELLRQKLGRFGEHYDTTNSSYLFRFLLGLCGEGGAGSVKKELLYPRLQSALDSTHFSDLDSLYGNPIGLPRISPEIYTVDPKQEALTQAQWQEVRMKDAQFRSRCLIWMRAILEGPTPTGIALAAEAACGVECDVFEQYKYIDNDISDSPLVLTNYGLTESRCEIVIMPRTASITEAEHRRINHLVDRLRPVNTIVTIFVNDRPRVEREARAVAATSEGFYVKKLVTGSTNIDWPPVDYSEGLWITTEETEAPTFAFVDRQESVTYLNIYGVTASSAQVGPFDKDQRALFSHLNREVDAFEEFSETRSYAKAIAPIQLTIPWIPSA